MLKDCRICCLVETLNSVCLSSTEGRGAGRSSGVQGSTGMSERNVCLQRFPFSSCLRAPGSKPGSPDHPWGLYQHQQGPTSYGPNETMNNNKRPMQNFEKEVLSWFLWCCNQSIWKSEAQRAPEGCTHHIWVDQNKETCEWHAAAGYPRPDLRNMRCLV